MQERRERARLRRLELEQQEKEQSVRDYTVIEVLTELAVDCFG